jgi:hypothetical protein
MNFRRLAAAFLFLSAPLAAQIRVAPIPQTAAPAAVPLGATPLLSPALAAPALLPAAPLLTAAPLSAAPAAVAPPAFAPVPAASPAPARAAAADGPRREVPDAGNPGPSAFWDGAAAPARSVNSFWSGFEYDAGDSGVSTLRVGDDEPDAGTAAPWLALKDRRLAASLDRAVELARTTAAGRRALDAAEKALAAQGITLPVDVKDLGGNWGEFDYLNGRLRLHRRLFEKGREAELAGTLAHELLHVAQHAAGLPSNALELEIEAHLLDLELMSELGLEPPPNTFARQIAEELRKGPKEFIKLLQAAVPGSPFLGESSFAEIVDQLEQDLDDAQSKSGPRAEKLAVVIESDLAMLRSKKGRAVYRAFSDRVLAELQRRAAAAR